MIHDMTVSRDVELTDRIHAGESDDDTIHLVRSSLVGRLAINLGAVAHDVRLEAVTVSQAVSIR